jgi:hypothetical protein
VTVPRHKEHRAPSTAVGCRVLKQSLLGNKHACKHKSSKLVRNIRENTVQTKICKCWESNPGRQACSLLLYRLSYPDHVSTLHFTFIAQLYLNDLLF